MSDNASDRSSSDAPFLDVNEGAIFDTVNIGFCVVELVYDAYEKLIDLVYERTNKAFERHASLHDVVGRKLSEVMPGFEAYWLDICGRVSETGSTEIIENYAQDTGQWYRSRVSSLAGVPGKVAIVFENFTERKRAELVLRHAEQRKGFLLKLNDALRPLSDPTEIKHVAACILGEHISAARVGYAEDMGDNGKVVVSRGYAQGVRGIEGVHTYSDFGAAQLMRLKAGCPDIDTDVASNQSLSENEKAAYAALQIGAVLNVPLLRNGKLQAILFIHYLTAHEFTEAEIELLHEVAERTWAEVMRAQAEDALRKSESRLAALFETLPLGVGVFDTSCGQVLANSTMQRYLPNSTMPSQDKGRGWRWRAWDEEGNPVPFHQFPGARALRGERVVPGLEMLYRNDDNTETWTSVSAVPLINAQGQISGQLGMITNIDAAKRVEIALRTSEARWKVLTNAMPHLVWTSEVRSGGSAYFNDQFLQYVGRGSDRLSRLDWLDVVHPDDRRAVKQSWIHANKSNSGFEIEVRLRRHDGAYRWFLARSVPTQLDDGSDTVWTGVCADIQALMEARLGAEAADRAKSEFLTNMSHEIRTPLNAIVGVATLLTTGMVKPEQHDLYLTTMRNGAEDLQRILTDVLEFASLDAGGGELNEQQFELSHLLTEVPMAIKEAAEAKGLAMSVLDLTDPGCQFVADKARISRALRNLLSNAVKFTDRGGVTLTVHGGDTLDGRPALTFAVQDTGIGVPLEKQRSIFETFVQADGSLQRKFGGVGLGLATSKRLAQILGGSLTIQSAAGTGALFLLTVPVSQVLKSGTPPGLPPPPPPVHKHVLLVDDDASDARGTELLLAKLGCTFETVSNGPATVQAFQSDVFDAILLDAQLADMDAVTLARRIRGVEQARALSRTPIYILKSLRFDKDERLQSVDVDGTISKPLILKGLRELFTNPAPVDLSV